MSIVLVVCMVLRFIGPLISIIWRIFVDNVLSISLFKLENIHETLLNMNIVTNTKKETLWLITIGLAIDYSMHMMLILRHVITNLDVTLWDAVSIHLLKFKCTFHLNSTCPLYYVLLKKIIYLLVYV